MKKVMLITGTSKGIGKYLAEYYIEHGYIVIGCSRSNPPGVLLSAKDYLHFQADVTQEEDIKKIIIDIDKKYNHLDILINNVGAASMNHFLLTPKATIDKLFKINYISAFMVSQEAAKLMMRNKWGRIINFSTVAVPLLIEGEAVYASIKSAIETLTMIIAKELKPFGITCNAIGPAPIETDLIKNVPKDKIRQILIKLPSKRLGQFEDVSNMIDPLISESGDSITGQIMYMGGL